MRPFSYTRPASAEAAVAAAAKAGANRSTTAEGAASYLAGGTTLLDLMKLDVMRPAAIVDINPLQRGHDQIRADANGLHLGALVRMATAADHPTVVRDYPVVAQSLALAASSQLRNMASLGGNALQRTRCSYFRDTSWAACNKRNPGSGCAAAGGFNRLHAVLGTSDQCIASYPGDFAQALIALDAVVEVEGPQGRRMLPFAKLHMPPGDTPEIETTLASGELITAYHLPALPWARRSMYLKVRDRQSYAFAMASAAVALDMAKGVVNEARIGLGGVATVPWRAREAEVVLKGQKLDEDVAMRAADAAFADAHTYEHNAFKVPLGKQTVVRALLATASMEV